MTRLLHAIAQVLHALGAAVLRVFESAGGILVLLVQTLRQLSATFHRPHQLFVQMARAGYESLLIAAAMAFLTGMVLALHSGLALRAYRAETSLANIVALSIVKEMGPLLVGMLVAGRVGAAIAAELGTMAVNEEIDALTTLGVNPIRYLVVPRFVALVLMVPVLVVYADLVGMAGGALMGKLRFDVPYNYYIRTVTEAVGWKDIAEGLVKAVLYGGLIAVVSCRHGLRARGGAEGVGRAITAAVVMSFVSLFIADYFVAWFMNY